MQGQWQPQKEHSQPHGTTPSTLENQKERGKKSPVEKKVPLQFHNTPKVFAFTRNPQFSRCNFSCVVCFTHLMILFFSTQVSKSQSYIPSSDFSSWFRNYGEYWHFWTSNSTLNFLLAWIQLVDYKEYKQRSNITNVDIKTEVVNAVWNIMERKMRLWSNNFNKNNVYVRMEKEIMQKDWLAKPSSCYASHGHWLGSHQCQLVSAAL